MTLGVNALEIYGKAEGAALTEYAVLPKRLSLFSYWSSSLSCTGRQHANHRPSNTAGKHCGCTTEACTTGTHVICYQFKQ
jgi:hypothetical protein